MEGSKLKRIAASPVGRKVLTGITGLALTGFVIGHLLGNLSYFAGGDAYNLYTHKLMEFGVLLYIVEIILLTFFLVHVYLGISIYLKKRAARPQDYEKYQSAGDPSKQSMSSRSMIFTGLLLFAFVIVHLLSFKFGPGVAEGYVTEVDGVVMRDLRRLLEEKFSHATYAFGYPLIMIMLGFHLRHGIWSALQSLGANNPRLSPVIYTAAGVLAVLLAVGFLVIPLAIYFGGGAA